MCYCLVRPAHHVKSQVYCTVELNMLKWVTTFPSAFLSIFWSGVGVTSLFFINISTSESDIWLQHMLNTIRWNVELFVKNLMFVGDFSSIVNLLVIADMLAAVKTDNGCTQCTVCLFVLNTLCVIVLSLLLLLLVRNTNSCIFILLYTG